MGNRLLGKPGVNLAQQLTVLAEAALGEHVFVERPHENEHLVAAVAEDFDRLPEATPLERRLQGNPGRIELLQAGGGPRAGQEAAVRETRRATASQA